MCYISDWPKRFLKPVLLQLSRHQVCLMRRRQSSRPHRTRPQQSLCRAHGGLPCVRGVTPHVCFLQVESLIENEAEKDYLYDVLRMYHQ